MEDQTTAPKTSVPEPYKLTSTTDTWEETCQCAEHRLHYLLTHKDAEVSPSTTKDQLYWVMGFLDQTIVRDEGQSLLALVEDNIRKKEAASKLLEPLAVTLEEAILQMREDLDAGRVPKKIWVIKPDSGSTTGTP